MNIGFVNKKFLCQGVNLDNIINSTATPFYLYSQKEIEQNYNNLNNTLFSEIFFSVKANSNQAILSLIKNLGAGADTVSAGEIQRCLKVGFNPDKIIYEGVSKSEHDIRYAIKQNIRLINIESLDEIPLINKIGQSLNKVVNVGVRLNPDIDAGTLNKISTGKKTDKFGINIEEIDSVISLVSTLQNIDLISISCHIGSQINDIKIFEKVFLKMKEAADHTLSKNINLKHLDLGGGFAVNYKKIKNDFDIKSIGKLVSSIFQNTPYKISFEPGRYLVAKAGILITKVITTKTNGNINYLITDAGMNTFIRPAMYGSFHRVEALNDLKENNINYHIAGPICESSDIIAKNVLLPIQKSGNYLIIHDAGAYGSVMASNYNSRGFPAEILVYKNNYSVIREAENITEIIKKDKIPVWLKSN